MLQEIKKSCEYVAKNSKFVSIDESKLIKLANSISNIEMNHWLSSSPFGLLELDIDKIVNFLLIYESINFSFWGNPKWEVNTPNGKLDGSIALLYSLLKYSKENNTTNFSNISSDDFAYILKGNIKIPLFEERFQIVKKVSDIVNEKMNGDFYKYIKDIKTDKELFYLIISNFDNFKDERTYDGQPVYLYKLAQLLVSDILYIRKIKENIEVDCTNLVGCADYKIPQVLRAMGIFVYNEELSNIVDNNVNIKQNSKYEVEIRANMINVICKLGKLLNDKYSLIQINDYIFMEKNNKSLALRPYHLTRNINY